MGRNWCLYTTHKKVELLWSPTEKKLVLSGPLHRGRIEKQKKQEIKNSSRPAWTVTPVKNPFHGLGVCSNTKVYGLDPLKPNVVRTQK